MEVRAGCTAVDHVEIALTTTDARTSRHREARKTQRVRHLNNVDAQDPHDPSCSMRIYEAVPLYDVLREFGSPRDAAHPVAASRVPGGDPLPQLTS
jgi:hypothetical protein